MCTAAYNSPGGSGWLGNFREIQGWLPDQLRSEEGAKAYEGQTLCQLEHPYGPY